ncbi:hypothetical protein P4050_15950 [Pseudomonas aeruginosa]|nr:hypothetical protein [Pseudomonas aeruginosa]
MNPDAAGGDGAAGTLAAMSPGMFMACPAPLVMWVTASVVLMASSLPLFFLMALGSRCGGVSTASSGRRRRRFLGKSTCLGSSAASCAALGHRR